MLLRKIGIFGIICIWTCSCKINGSLQGLTSYYKKVNKAAPELIQQLDEGEAFCGHRYTDSLKVIMGNAIDLEGCLETSAKSIVFLWTPNCSSELCFDLELLQAACSNQDYSLYVVAEYYDKEEMQKNQKLEYPILGIDIQYYRSNFSSKYVKRFLKELTNTEREYKRLLYFEAGEFVKAVDRLEELPSATKELISNCLKFI